MKQKMIFLLALLLLFCGLFSFAQADGEYALGETEKRASVGKSFYLTVRLDGEKVSARQLSWLSADPDIATVSSRGKVYAKSPGDTLITATASNGQVLCCALTVIQPVSKVRLDQSRMTLSVGETAALNAVVLPRNATDKALLYTSSNEEVATIDAQGNITALKAGRTKLTACSANGEKDTLTLTVTQPVTSIIITDQSLSVERGKRVTLGAQALPADATDRKLTYSSSDKKVATVSSKGVVKGRAAGTAIITVKSSNGLTALVEITITQPVTRVAFSFSRKTIGKYETVTLPPVVSPANATDPSLTWQSSNPSIASVNPAGEITGHKVGTVTITARAANGKKDSFKLTVEEIPVTGILIDRLHWSIAPGQSVSLGAQVRPENATEQRIVYTSSAPEVVSVDENGLLTALKEGNALITASTTGENIFTRSCQVQVSQQPTGRLEGITIGINPGHQTRSNSTPIPIAPGAKETVYSIKVGTAGVVTRVPEYQVNLLVSLKLQQLLEAEGATVVMTRTSNQVNLSNIERANIMNEAGCDLALQIHCNGSSNKNRSGLSVYAKRTGVNALRSQELASLMLPTLLEITGAKDAGCNFSDGYASLNWSTVPSVLIEMGYMSNAKEDRLLASDEYQTLLAQAICESICTSFAK